MYKLINKNKKQMKKFFLLLVALATVTVSCQKVAKTETEPAVDSTEVVVDTVAVDTVSVSE